MGTMEQAARALSDVVWRAVYSQTVDAWHAATAVLTQVGSSRDAAWFAAQLPRLRRDPCVLEDQWLSGKQLSDVLRGHPEEGVTRADWTVDYLDPPTRRYCLGYLFSSHHLLYLMCRFLVGAPVPDDVAVMCLHLRLQSRVRRDSTAAYWEALLPPVYRLGLDA